MLARLVSWVPALAKYDAKRYGERSAPVFFRVGTGECAKSTAGVGWNRGTSWEWRCSAFSVVEGIVLIGDRNGVTVVGVLAGRDSYIRDGKHNDDNL